MIKKGNRDEVKDRAMNIVIEIIHDENKQSIAQGLCERVMYVIADRIIAGVKEPDVNDFELELTSEQASANSSPPSSPEIHQMVPITDSD